MLKLTLMKVVVMTGFVRTAIFFAVLGPINRRAVAAGEAEKARPAQTNSDCSAATEHSLELPSNVPPDQLAAFERSVLEFLQTGKYKQLGWCGDKRVRDTGPFINKVYYGTHPAVRVFFSPMMMGWLIGGRQGAIPDVEVGRQ